MHTIYIVEDHTFFRMLLQEFIDHIPGLKVCGLASTGREALEEIPRLVPDLAIIDLSLPDIDGVQVVAELRTKVPEMPTVILSTYRDDVYVQRALKAGAKGYIEKGDPKEIEIGIRSVIEGETYLSPQLLDAI